MHTQYFSPQCSKSNCPFHLSCSRIGTRLDAPDFFELEKGIDFLFIGDAATREDMYNYSPFSGLEGELLQSSIKEITPDKSIAYTYLVRGWPVDQSSVPSYLQYQQLYTAPKHKLDSVKSKNLITHPDGYNAIAQCWEFLIQDIERLNPKNLVVLGNSVLAALFPRESRSITRLETETLYFHNVPTKFLSSPSAIVRNPSSADHWKKQLKFILTGERAKLDTAVAKTRLITDINEAIEYIEYLINFEGEVAVDTETRNLNKRYGNKLGTIQFATNGDEGVVIPYLHPETPFSPEEIKILDKHLYRLFSGEIPVKILHWICHNAKFENHILRNSVGTSILSAPIFDTQIGAFLLDENRVFRAADFKYGIYTLKQLAYDYLNYDGYNKDILSQRDEGNLFDLPLEQLAEYGSMDSWVTWRLKQALYNHPTMGAKVQNFAAELTNLMYNLYSPEIQLFTDIECNGSPVSRQHLRKLLSRTESPLLKHINSIEDSLQEDPHAQRANDLLLDQNSPPGMKIMPLGKKPWIFDFSKKGHPQKLFFEVKGLTPIKYGKSGAGSVDNEWQTANEHDNLVKLYSEWSLMRKMYDSFAKQIYEYVDPTRDHVDCNTDSRLRPNFLLSSVVTGRVACRNPNLQAIPRAENDAKKSIKNIFQALPDHGMVQLDFKANEIRWVGLLAQDHTLAANIRKGKEALDEYRKNPTPEQLHKAELLGDIHRQNAAQMFDTPIDDVTKIQRQAAKSLIFGILYDSSEWAIAQKLDKTEDEVKILFSQFYNKFTSVAAWKREMKVFAQKYGYVQAPQGRRRRFPIFDFYRVNGIYMPHLVPRDQRSAINESLRQASNAPVQGIASDAAMIGAFLFANYIRENKKPWIIQNAVHDSCIFQVPLDELEEALKAAEKCFADDLMDYMNKVFDINFILPLECEFEIGLKWGELEKWNFSGPELATIKEKLEVNRSQ